MITHPQSIICSRNHLCKQIHTHTHTKKICPTLFFVFFSICFASFFSFEMSVYHTVRLPLKSTQLYRWCVFFFISFTQGKNSGFAYFYSFKRIYTLNVEFKFKKFAHAKRAKQKVKLQTSHSHVVLYRFVSFPPHLNYIIITLYVV